jgi:SAM-dependent methyltransferase
MTTGKAGNPSADVRRQQVRARYAGIASGGGCCSTGGESTSCCGSGTEGSSCGQTAVAAQLGYATKELADLPEGANLGLGCGNPTAILALKPRQVVLDLGSGAGIDCFLAAKKVGAKGHVIGVDMTPEMVGKARENARKGRFANVEFRLGEIEHLPVADASVDVVISNCVINLAPEKGPVYREAFRVLRPGGHLAISDVVATRPISARDRADPSLWSSCSSGALDVKEVKTLLKKAGFKDVHLDLKVPEQVPDSLRDQASLGVVSADIRATKPVE